MKLRAIALLLVAVACGDPAPPRPASPPLVTAPGPSLIDETAFVRVARANPAILVVGDAACTGAPHDCWRFTEGEPVGAKATPIAVSDVPRSFELEGKTCRLGIDAKLACGDPALDATDVQLLRGDLLFGKRPTRDLVAYFGDYDAPNKLRPITTLPAKLRQVSIAVRVGCALTESREVWCWSDPKRPRKRVVPPDVEDIAVTDPFALCVRTAAGEVSCTPPVAMTGEVWCDNKGTTCRHRPEAGQQKGKPFDPVTPVMAPLDKVPFRFAARRFVRDEYLVQPIVPDFTEDMFGDPHAGGCALGPAGEVACTMTCTEGRSVAMIEMPPVIDVRSDATTGYGVTATGELWTWPRVPEPCTQELIDKPRLPFYGTVTATRAALPPMAHLAPLVHYEGRRKFGTDVRCVSLRDGTVKCWETTDAGKVFELPTRN